MSRSQLPADWPMIVRQAVGRYARSWLPLADLEQDAAVAVLSAFDATDRVGNPAAFVFVTARNAAAAAYRRERQQPATVAESPPRYAPDHQDPAQLAALADARAVVDLAVAQLRPAERRAIAERLAGVTVVRGPRRHTAKTHAYRARRRLQELPAIASLR